MFNFNETAKLFFQSGCTVLDSHSNLGEFRCFTSLSALGIRCFVLFNVSGVVASPCDFDLHFPIA